MSVPTLSSGSQFLLDAAERYFRATYESPPPGDDAKLYAILKWNPGLHVKIDNYHSILVEASETRPYPQVLRLRYATILSVHQPIIVYSVCPLEIANATRHQKGLNNLASDGFGLLTVDRAGNVAERLHAIPLIHRVSESEFRDDIQLLSLAIRRRLVQCFQTYKNKPPSGVGEVAEVLEGLVLRAGKDAVTKGLLTTAQAKAGRSANTLDALSGHPKTKSQNAAWGGARSYIKEYRHVAHHYATTKKDAKKKYVDCKYAFITGWKQISSFIDACKKSGFSGRLP